MFSFLKRDRFVVATLVAAIPKADALQLHRQASAAVSRIREEGAQFGVASEETARIARALLDREHTWSHVGGWGDVYDSEADAAEAADAAFADAAGRYLAGADDEPVASTARQGEVVVMLTLGYAGEIPDIEKTIATREDLRAALSAVGALHDADRLLLAHVHVAPGHPDDAVTEEQMLTSFPELITV
jgi:hypothetical protein